MEYTQAILGFVKQKAEIHTYETRRLVYNAGRVRKQLIINVFHLGSVVREEIAEFIRAKNDEIERDGEATTGLVIVDGLDFDEIIVSRFYKGEV